MSQHYDFAHQAFPQIVFETPAARVREVLTGDFTDFFLEDVWHDLGEPSDREQPDDLPDDIGEFIDAHLAGEFELGPDPEAPKASEAEVAGHRAVLVTMAPPAQPVEAYFVLVILEPAIRYFTLEKPMDESEAGATVCEWKIDEDGRRHRNYGSIPSADADAFVAKVEELLEA